MMTEEYFLDKLANVIDAESGLNLTTILANIEEWDSLSVVSFIAMANMEAGKKLQATEIQDAKTVADLYELVK